MCLSFMLTQLARASWLVLTAEKVRLALAEEDKANSGGEESSLHAEVTASMFIQQGIDLEDLR